MKVNTAVRTGYLNGYGQPGWKVCKDCGPCYNACILTFNSCLQNAVKQPAGILQNTAVMSCQNNLFSCANEKKTNLCA